MMKKLISTITLALTFLVVFCMTSCSKDCEFKCYLLTKNSTENNIYVEYMSEVDTIQNTICAPDESISVTFGKISQHKGYPSDTYISERLQYVKIYRKVNDSVQQLPKHYYDGPDDFSLSNDFFMGTYESRYYIDITSDMFSE